MRSTSPRRRHAETVAATLAILASVAVIPGGAWSPQGHRVVALLAANHLSQAARQNIRSLLADESLADVADWADQYLVGNYQTSFWHYVNIPDAATRYDRSRDCPRQPAVAAGTRGDRWRDCVVDRIEYNEQRLADRALDRADRAVALKFLVHLVGDVHQPFHALAAARGGNGIPVSAFGSGTCGQEAGAPHPCNLHGVWDTELIAHRHLSDRAYVAALERLIAQRGWAARAGGTAADWAMESHDIAAAALLSAHGSVDEGYYRRHISDVDERLALGGLRLAAVLDRILSAP